MLNRLIRVSRVEVGGGIAPVTSEKLAVLESLLPNFTFQLGPPSYNNNQLVKIKSQHHQVLKPKT